MPVPSLNDSGYLPAGDHPATWKEIEDAFTSSYGRRQLLSGLLYVVRELQAKGVKKIWIDGSFVTSKPRPRDIDVLYEVPTNEDNSTWGLLSPVRRHELKQNLRIDLWATPALQPPKLGLGNPIPLHDLWATDRDNLEKGMLFLKGVPDDQKQLSAPDSTTQDS